ncbi:hypothetical protein BDV93DRAFT_287047 [Ceratobasidium sp. AG-I]|nr:hypothetical protein BDV93DRAFT_287047 [Ceratobasidium sp. AG-I]
MGRARGETRRDHGRKYVRHDDATALDTNGAKSTAASSGATGANGASTIEAGNYRLTYEESTTTLPIQPYHTSLRAGRFGRLSVAYMTFAADSGNVAHELVQQELDCISRSLHINVAQLVRVTEGYSGLNGIIVAMDGIDIQEFLTKRRSGAVWAKCIEGFEVICIRLRV